MIFQATVKVFSWGTKKLETQCLLASNNATCHTNGTSRDHQKIVSQQLILGTILDTVFNPKNQFNWIQWCPFDELSTFVFLKCNLNCWFFNLNCISGEEAHIYALVNPPSPAENDSMQGYGSYGILQFSQPKKATLSEDLDIDDNVLGIFPVLHHKLPSDA